MRILLLCIAFTFGSNAFAQHKHDFDAEAALALAAAAHKKPLGPTPPGYEKVSIDGGPWHFRKIENVPEVTIPKGTTFQQHAGHNCPSCGRSQYVISGFNRDGSHNHTCPACGTTWSH